MNSKKAKLLRLLVNQENEKVYNYVRQYLGKDYDHETYRIDKLSKRQIYRVAKKIYSNKIKI